MFKGLANVEDLLEGDHFSQYLFYFKDLTGLIRAGEDVSEITRNLYYRYSHGSFSVDPLPYTLTRLG